MERADIFVERTDYFVERSDYWLERSDLNTVRPLPQFHGSFRSTTLIKKGFILVLRYTTFFPAFPWQEWPNYNRKIDNKRTHLWRKRTEANWSELKMHRLRFDCTGESTHAPWRISRGRFQQSHWLRIPSKCCQDGRQVAKRLRMRGIEHFRSSFVNWWECNIPRALALSKQVAFVLRPFLVFLSISNDSKGKEKCSKGKL